MSAMQMELTTALHIRDAYTKAEIYESKTFNSLSAADQEKIEELIERAFDRADAKWRERSLPPSSDTDKIILGVAPVRPPVLYVYEPGQNKPVGHFKPGR